MRHLQELTRRDETKLPDTGSVEPWQDLTPYLQPGWAGTGTYPGQASVKFYKDRDRVYLTGVAFFDASAPGADSTRIATMPVGYRPAITVESVILHTVYNGTDPSTVGTWWEAFVSASGGLDFDSNPAFPGIGMPPDGTWLFLTGCSYRLT